MCDDLSMKIKLFLVWLIYTVVLGGARLIINSRDRMENQMINKQFLASIVLYLFIPVNTQSNYTISSVSVSRTPTGTLMAGSGGVTLTCNVSITCSQVSCMDNDDLTISWTLNGQPIDSSYLTETNNSPYSITNTNPVTSTLTNSTISPIHAGVYICTGTLDSGSTNSGTNTVNVQIPSPMVNVTSTIASVGDNTALVCTPSISGGISHVTYTYSWSPGSDTDNTLNINGVSVSDAGQYTCTVTASYTGSNSAYVTDSTGSGSGTLTVNVPSPMVTVTSDITNVGGDTALTCTPSVSGVSMSDVDYTYSWSPGSDTDDTLNINGVSVSDAGQYTCTVTASYTGSNSAYVTDSTGSGSGTLTVNVPSPMVTVTSDITNVGGDTALTCTPSVSGVSMSDVDYTYSWSPGSDTDDTLNINGVSVSDAGQYTCTVTASYTGSNSAYVTDSTGSGMGTLYVTDTTVSPVSITRLIASPYDVFDITCLVTLTPNTANTITYAWMIPNGFTSSNTASSTLTATVNSTPNTYTVTCNAIVTVTGVGMATASDSGTIIVKGPSNPIKPVITAISVTPNDATISWTISEVTYTPEIYVIECGVEMNNFNLTSSSVSTMNIDDRGFTTDNDIGYTQTITGLNILITYFCRINSTNTIGTNYSDTFNFTTEETIPHAPNATLVAVSSTSFILSWKEPKPFTGAITDYNYTCVNVNGSVSYTSSDMTPNNPSLMSVTLTGLQPHREYTCNVTASTSKGIGAIGTVNGITNEATPTGPPLSFIITSNNPNGFTLNWSPPDIQLRNGIIRSYTYSCTEVGSTTLLIPPTITFDTTATVQMTSIIKPYTNYNCSVYAATSVGSGPSTSTIGITAEDIPSEVVSLSVSSSDASFHIFWSPPALPNGIIAYYTVRLRNYTNGHVLYTVNVTVPSLIINNEGLVSFIPYSISVSGATVAGNGNEVSVIGFTREGVPSSVKGLAFDRINITAINISWTPLTLVEAKGFVEYTLIVTSSSDTTHVIMTLSGDVSHIIVNSIQSNVDYRVILYGSTNGGGSGPSVTLVIPKEDEVDNSNIVIVAVSGSSSVLILLISIVIVMVTSVWIILKCRKKKSVDIKNNNPDEPEYEMITNSNTKPAVQPAAPPLYDVPVSSPRDVNVQVQDNVAYSAI